MMKKLIRNDEILGMCNLVPKRTGLKVNIWADHKGVLRNVRHNTPRVKISYGEYSISVSIEEDPKILSKSNKIPNSVMTKLNEGIKYVSDNYSSFLKHFNDTDDDFDDVELFRELGILN